MQPYIIGVDIGGTQIRAARADATGRIDARASDLTRGAEGREAVLARLEQTIWQVWPADGAVTAIGVGAPGPLDPHTGVILRCPNIPGWDDYPLRAILQERFGLPVHLGDDANLAALAEHRWGAGRGHSHMIYLTISTGLGSGIIINDQLLLGVGGLAGEAGCMVVDPHGPLCACGNPGCLEALVSGPAIARAARRRLAQGEASSLAAESEALMTAKSVHEAAQRGDPLALDVLREAGAYLGLGLVSLLHLFNPSIIVIGGSVSQASRYLFEPARAVIRQRCLSEHYWRNTPIVTAALGDDVGLLGAVCLVLYSQEHL